MLGILALLIWEALRYSDLKLLLLFQFSLFLCIYECISAANVCVVIIVEYCWDRTWRCCQTSYRLWISWTNNVMASARHTYDWTHWKWKQGKSSPPTPRKKAATQFFCFPLLILRIVDLYGRLSWIGSVMLLYPLGKKLHRLKMERLILTTTSWR